MPVQHHMWGIVLETLKRDPVQTATCNALSLSHHATNVREAGSPAQDGAVPVSTYGDQPLPCSCLHRAPAVDFLSVIFRFGCFIAQSLSLFYFFRARWLSLCAVRFLEIRV